MTGDPHLYYSSFSSELLAKFRRVGHLVAHNSTTGADAEAKDEFATLRSIAGA